MSIKKKFKIEGMHCSSCAMSIDFDLEDLDGVTKASTSYARAECEIECEEDKISDEIIIQTIQKVGYQAQTLKP